MRRPWRWPAAIVRYDPFALTIRRRLRVKVGEDGTKSELRDDRRLIAAELNGPKATLFCPRGILTREELDLVDIVGNSLLLDQLLPEKPVAVETHGNIPMSVVAALCGIETVRSNEVPSVLKEVDDQLAKIELSGRVEGSVSGQATKIELKAKYQFQRNIGRISWCGLLVQEDRSAGPMGPGLDVLARLRMKIDAKEKSESLNDASLRGLPSAPLPELEQLSYISPGGGWEISYDRRWVLIRDKRDEAVFRLADQGSLSGRVHGHPNGQSSSRQARYSPTVPGRYPTRFGQELSEVCPSRRTGGR